MAASSAEQLRQLSQNQHISEAREAAAKFGPVAVEVHARPWTAATPVPEGAKLVHWVRHGQGYHNLISEVSRQLGASFSETGKFELAKQDSFNPYMIEGIRDPPLTCLGIADAKALSPIAKTLNPELLVVSPLKRATQTILTGFKEALKSGRKPRVVAHEGCREQIGVHLCDMRSAKSDYAEEFPTVDASYVECEEDPSSYTQRETYLEMAERSHSFMLWLRDQPEKEIVVGTHSAFLVATLNVAIKLDDESTKTFFKTGELRSLILEFVGKSDKSVGMHEEKPESTSADNLSLCLSNGVSFPMVGFGTAFFADGVRRPEITYSALPMALDAGYRLVDAAVMYGNMVQVGGVLGRYFMDGKLEREAIFVTTKVGHPPTADYPAAKTQYLFDPRLNAYDGVLQEFYSGLQDLGLGYVDLLLVHWPGMFDMPSRYPKGSNFPVPRLEAARQKRAEMWAALEHLYQLNLVRAIGVSNFTKDHLEDLMKTCKVTPMVNQIEAHPYLSQEQLVKYCHGKNIQVTAYSPLAAGRPDLMKDPVLTRLAAARGLAVSQIVLSWLLQRGVAVIPKSSKREQLEQNLKVSKELLSPFEMKAISDLNRDLHICPDPASIS